MLRLVSSKEVGASVGAALVRDFLLAFARRPLEGVTNLVTRRPLLLLLLLRLVEEVAKRWAAYRRLELGRLRVQRATDEIDAEIIQGCLISAENLLTLGRIEKRTLFHRPLLEVFGGNTYLVQELLEAAQVCRRCSNNCMVTRWLPPDERYHVLQSTLNVVSSLFGTNFVHFNALGDENQFKSTWYCLTVMTPTRPETIKPKSSSKWDTGGEQADNTCTFTDMSRTPRATLRVIIANESEVRKISDGKLKPPSWGFFNSRHAERYRMLQDLAKNFQLQLLRTPAGGTPANARSPFTSERVHLEECKEKPDGGLFKRVRSHPNVAQAAYASSPDLQALAAAPAPPPTWGSEGIQEEPISPAPIAKSGLKIQRQGSRTLTRRVSFQGDDLVETKGPFPDDDNCFLRLHVPHHIGQQGTDSGSSLSSSRYGPTGRRRIGSAPFIGGAPESVSFGGFGPFDRTFSP